MKKSILIFSAVAITMVSCKKENQNTTETTSTEAETTTPETATTPEENENDAVTNGTYCFLHALNKDSMKVKLNLDGSKISGDLDRIPFEKDRAKGIFTGTKRANGKFDVDFKYMQEGMDKNAKLVFDVDKNKLEISGDPVYNSELNAVACQ